MPVVTIQTWAGKSVEQKEKLMKGIKKAFMDIGVDPNGLTIIIHDVPRYNWAKAGEQVSKEA
jgi:4-oxalocrotonate tautomerase family enzyme